MRRSEGQASPLQHPLRYRRTLSSYTSTFVVDLIGFYVFPDLRIYPEHLGMPSLVVNTNVDLGSDDDKKKMMLGLTEVQQQPPQTRALGWAPACWSWRA